MKSIQYPKKVVIYKAAEILRECVRGMINSHSTVSWSPKVNHSISYDMVCWIETAQAELSQGLLKTSNMLPLKTDQEGGQVRSLC